MDIIICGETSQIITTAFRKKGHNAYSCDLLDTFGVSQYHIKDDMFNHLNDGWDMAIFHPDCTFLTVANTYIKRGCSKYTAAQAVVYREKAKENFMRCVHSGIKKTVIENPVGIMSTYYRKPDQIIQPYEFGDNASKGTCLWLIGGGMLPLKPTCFVAPRIVNGRNRWANQTDSGQNNILPCDNRWQLRSKTYPGIAAAMANQWG